MPKVVMLEFNEICPPLIERWMGEGRLPHFAEFHQGSQTFTTVADESDPVNLEPWIQWYSIHTGLPFREHRVFHLTDGPKADHIDLWQELRGLGKSVMNCSSMNARAIAGDGSFYLPDPWCASEPAYPPELEAFSQVVSQAVKEYSREGRVLSISEMAAFVKFLVSHGLSPHTVAAIGRQLFGERLSRTDLRWQRVALLDRLQFDIFRHYYRRNQPDFATFFINSTAHLQHAYWRAMDPDAFQLKPSRSEIEAYGEAVLFGYQAMDQLLRDFMALADDDTILVLCSALSQQPFVKRDDRGGQHFYRLRDPAGFLHRIGVEPERIEPVMTHQYLLRFANAGAADASAAALRAVRLGGESVFGATQPLAGSLLFGCQIYGTVAGDAELAGTGTNHAAPKFFQALYAIDTTKSGCHHPDGLLWIRTGRYGGHDRRVSILDIPATVCELLGVHPAASSTGSRGESLVSLFAAPATARQAA